MEQLLQQLDPETAARLVRNLIPQIVVIVIGLSAIYGALRIAWHHMQWLRDLEDEFFFDVQIARQSTITRETTIKTKLADIERKKSEKLWTAWANFWSLLLTGIIVPTATMMVVAIWYGWFFAGAAPLVDALTGAHISNPTFAEALDFVFAQIVRAPLDLVEVFCFEFFSRVTYDQSENIFALLVFLYRSLVGGFIGAAGIFLFRVIRFRNAKGESQKHLEGKLAHHQN